MSAYVKKSDVFVSSQKLFDVLFREEGAAFLDSSLVNELGQYSMIAIHPYLELKEIDGQFYKNGVLQQGSMELYLKTYLQKEKEVNQTFLPLVSGGIGYFSYDYGRKFEKIKTRHSKKLGLPDALITFYDNFIIEDIENKTLYLIANGKLAAQKESVKRLEELVKQCNVSEESFTNKTIAKRECGDVEKNFQKQEYIQAIQDVIEYIKQGHIYVMNMTQQLEIESKKPPYEVFKELQKKNPAPFSAYMSGEYGAIISASPERFIKIRDGKIETRPIKGTRKRGNTPQEDLLLKEELRDSEKDKSELLMIVDLERNDLNRICLPGTVKVSELFKVETYATVFHLVSNVEGTLRQDVDFVDVLRAMFPGGSITGAPKVRAMEIIDELEHDQRGIYTGIIGYISLSGDCEFNIAIRTAVYDEEKYHIGVGGGITYESDTEFEYEETLQKGKALIEAIRG